MGGGGREREEEEERGWEEGVGETEGGWEEEDVYSICDTLTCGVH